jgi:hypothetical protein
VAVPSFRVRAHVDAENGVAPTTQQYDFFVTYYGLETPAVSSTVRVTGTTDTGWITVDTTVLNSLVTSYNNGFPPAYLEMADLLVCNLICSPVVGSLVKYTTVSGQVECTETGIVTSFTLNLFDKRLGICSWRELATGSPPNPNIGESGGTAKSQTLYHFNKRYFDLVDAHIASVPPKPTLIHSSDGYAAGDHARENWVGGLKMLDKLGVTTMVLPSAMDAHLKPLLDANTLIRKIRFDVYNPPAYHFGWHEPMAGDNPDIPNAAGMATAASRQLARVQSFGYTASDVATISVADEPSFYYDSAGTVPTASFANSPIAELYAMRNGILPMRQDGGVTWAAALQDFRDYAVTLGYTPALLGGAVWSDILPVGKSKATGTLPERRLWYVSSQWFPLSSSLHYALFTSALRDPAKFGSTVPIVVNWNNGASRSFNPLSYNRHTPPTAEDAGGAHDWQEFLRLGGTSAIWMADYTSEVFSWWDGVRQMRLDQAARRNGGISGYYYTAGASTGIVPGATVRRHVDALGQGAKFFARYQAGGVHVTVDGYLEDFFRHPALIDDMADWNGLLTAVEADAYPAIPVRRTDVAIVYPRASQPWDEEAGGQGVDGTQISDGTVLDPVLGINVDYMAEFSALLLRLAMANISVTVLEERDLTATGLANVKVLYVTGLNLSDTATAAVTSWTNTAGHHLVTTPGAGQRTHDTNEFRTNGINTLGSVTESNHARMANYQPAVLPYLPQITSLVGNAQPRGFTVVPSSWRTSITAPPGTTEGTWADNLTSAFVNVPVGSGRHTHFSFFPGTSWLALPYGASTALPTNFDDVIGEWITRPVTINATIKQNVEGATRLVRAGMLSTSTKCLVTLANWNPTSQSVSARIRPVLADGTAIAPGSVTSYRHGPLTYTYDGDGFTITNLPLQYGDVLTITPSGAPPTTTAVGRDLTLRWNVETIVGGGAGFLPTDVPGLAAWYHTDALSLADGVTVSAWPDSSGSARTLTQATSAKQPTFRTSQLNGHAAVRFSGTGQLLKSAGFTLNQPVTMFFVMKLRVLTDQYIHDGFASVSQLMSHSGGTLYIYAGSFVLRAGTDIQPHIYEYVYNGASSHLRFNGVTTTGDTGTSNAGGLTLGNAAGEGATSFDGDAFEWIVYNGIVSDADKDQIGNYLAAKYALSWSTLTAAGKSLSLAWNTQAAVGKSLSAQWAVRTTIADTLGLVWHTRAPASDTLGLLWNVESLSGMSVVGKSLALQWNVLSTIQDSLTLVWSDLFAVSDSLTLRWVTNSLTPTTPTVYIFEPTIAYDNPPTLPSTKPPARDLWRWYKARARGRTVIQRANGTFYTTDMPTSAELDSALNYYLGGHVYVITQAEADALTAAGYGPNIRSIP